MIEFHESVWFEERWPDLPDDPTAPSMTFDPDVNTGIMTSSDISLGPESYRATPLYVTHAKYAEMIRNIDPATLPADDRVLFGREVVIVPG